MHDENIRFHVDGLHCGGCVRRLRQHLEQLPGTNGIHIDQATGECRIEHTDLTGEAVLVSLTGAGYSACPAH